MNYLWTISINRVIGAYSGFECVTVMGTIKSENCAYPGHVCFMPYNKMFDRDLLFVEKSMVFNSEEDALSKVGDCINQCINQVVLKRIKYGH